jgi:hypothetical protein
MQQQVPNHLCRASTAKAATLSLSRARGGCAAHNISLELLGSACCSDKAHAFFFIVIIAAVVVPCAPLPASFFLSLMNF